MPPRPSSMQEHGDLGADHDAVGGAVEPLPVADIARTLMVMPLTRMQATPAIDMRENRAPTSRQAGAVCDAASASRKQGMPPIQIAAPNWCRHSTTSSGARLSSRAAAWVVSVAAASSIRQSADQRRHRRALR